MICHAGSKLPVPGILAGKLTVPRVAPARKKATVRESLLRASNPRWLDELIDRLDNEPKRFRLVA